MSTIIFRGLERLRLLSVDADNSLFIKGNECGRGKGPKNKAEKEGEKESKKESKKGAAPAIGAAPGLAAAAGKHQERQRGAACRYLHCWPCR
ncbi:MAG: hypothetical protein ACR2PJ_03640 [Pseudomonadales bacterium]